MSEYIDPQVNDIVRKIYGGEPGKNEWRVEAVSRVSGQVYVAPLDGTISPQWENRSDVTFVRRPSEEAQR